MYNPVSFIPVASDFMSEQEQDLIIDKYADLFEQNGIIRSEQKQVDENSELIFFILSGGVEGKVLQLVNIRQKMFPSKPIILLAQPENNSLPAALEILARLKQDNIVGRIFQLAVGSSRQVIKDLLAYLSSGKGSNPIITQKIGLVGPPSDWLIASSPDLSLVKRKWGTEIITVELQDLYDQIGQIKKIEVEQLVNDLRKGADSILEAEPVDLVASVKVYLALKKIITQHQLSGLSLRCFDLVKELGMTGCYALAKLNEEGICSACEGDIVSLLGMIWIKQLTGLIPWMANPAQIDLQKQEILLAHCTIAFDLIESYRIRSHFESGIGVGIAGKLPLQTVTLLRLGGRELNRLWVCEGKIVEIPAAENLCRTQVLVSVQSNNQLEELLNDPLGNHLLLLRGSYRQLILKNWKNISI